MFRGLHGGSGLRLRGGKAALLLGPREAAVLSAWSIKKHDDHWRLTGTLARVDLFQVRRKGLLFTAPRAGGFWAWGVESVEGVVGTQIHARLGPPEQ